MSRPAVARGRRLAALLTLLGLAAASSAEAHELAPAYLRLEARPDGTWRAHEKRPAREGAPHRAHARFAARCVERGPERIERSPRHVLVTRVLDCGPGGAEVLGLRFEGLDDVVREAIVELETPEGRRVLHLDRAHPAAPSAPPPPPLSAYLGLGLEHIAGGLDHLLFVLGLALAVARGSGRRGRRLLGAVTAFTAAHSLSLAAVVLGGLSLPPAPVEWTIASSLFVLAAALARDDRRELALRAPAAAAFAFGLLHGLGFAGALAAVGLPPDDRVLALLGFNLGVELGQLAFVAGLAGLARALGPLRVQRWEPAVVTALGAASVYWCAERGLALIAPLAAPLLRA